MQFAIAALTQSFTETTGIPCELIIGSSGKLTAQIKEGAPYHLLLSADMKYPTELFKSGFADTSPQIYAYGKLVLWTMTKEIQPSIHQLLSENIQYIALANPKTAPYGKAAIEVLQHYHLQEKIKAKLVYGESIAQTNQFITSKAAEIGFTAKSVLLSPHIKGKGHWVEIADTTYSPIGQGIIILKNKNKTFHQQAQQFYNFIFSPPAQSILKNLVIGFKLLVPSS